MKKVDIRNCPVKKGKRKVRAKKVKRKKYKKCDVKKCNAKKAGVNSVRYVMKEERELAVEEDNGHERGAA